MSLMVACVCEACRVSGGLLSCEWPRCSRPAEALAHDDAANVRAFVCTDHLDAYRRETPRAPWRQAMGEWWAGL